LPYVFLAIGNHDGFRTFLRANRALTDSLRVYGGRYEYHELPGQHSWRFWDAELVPMLTRAWDTMTESTPPNR
jgi:enterochelin esterase-like enzyme